MSQFMTNTVQTLAVTSSLVAAGGIATLSLFDIPILQSQPASRSLPSTRWLFSRGSHIFPTAAAMSGAGFAYLAYASVTPQSATTFRLLLKAYMGGGRATAYVAAAVLCFSIGPFTRFAMVPTNFALIKMNESKGGSRSAAAAREFRPRPGGRTAEDSVNGKDEGSQFRDLSGPQAETPEKSTAEEDRRAQELFQKFGRLNAVRAVLLGAGGVLGLVTALAL